MFQPGYIGGKASAGVYHRIIGNMPPHSVYVEPFFGSGAVFYHKRPAEKNILIDRSRSVIARIDVAAGISAICGDAISEIPKLTLPADALVYCDPPYMLATRQGRLYYEHEPESDDPNFHASLLALLQKLKCRVMISGYWSELYVHELRNWRCQHYQARTRGKTATEFLWCNFDEPTELHDWRYAGKTFRERLTLKRQAKRWIARIEAMPVKKRGYFLHALSEKLSVGSKRHS